VTMRVLLAGPYARDPKQGSPRVLICLAEELERLGCRVELLLTDGLPAWARKRRLRWATFPIAVLARARRAAGRGAPYDVIDVSSGDGFLVGLLRKSLGLRDSAYICRTMGWEHEDYRVRVAPMATSRLDALRRGLLTRAVRHRQVELSVKTADALITLCSADRRFAVDRGWQRLERVYPVPAGVSSDYLNGSRPKRGGGLMFWGTWSIRKGIQQLVEAYTTMRARGYEVPLTIGGCWDAAENVRRAFPESLRPLVKVWDRPLTASELREEFRRHDIFVLPSFYEGFGIVVLEAMASGLAVVTTPVGVAEDMIEDKGNGRLVPIGDAAALADALIEMWNSPALRARLGAAARRTARANSWERIAARTLEVYQMVIAQRTPPQPSPEGRGNRTPPQPSPEGRGNR
jgi:glycosyltransferase involved in cell wall biosynthesis